MTTKVRLQFGFFSAAIFSLTLMASGQTVAGQLVEKEIEANGYKFSYAEMGDGPLMVMIHGGLSDQRSFYKQMKLLAKDFRVVTPTQRYYGKGNANREGPELTEDIQADDVAAFIKALGAGPAHLVGHSMGGRNAHYASLRHPDIARSVFLFEGAVGIPSKTKKEDRTEAQKKMRASYGKAWGPVGKAIKAKDFDKAGRLLIDNVSGDKTYYDRADEETKLRWKDNGPSFGRYMARKRTARMSCEDMIAKSKVPTVLVVGTKAEAAPGVPYTAIFKRHADCLGDSGSIKLVEGVTHMWPYMEPKDFVEAVKGFAQKH